MQKETWDQCFTFKVLDMTAKRNLRQVLYFLGPGYDCKKKLETGALLLRSRIWFQKETWDWCFTFKVQDMIAERNLRPVLYF